MIIFSVLGKVITFRRDMRMPSRKDALGASEFGL